MGGETKGVYATGAMYATGSDAAAKADDGVRPLNVPYLVEWKPSGIRIGLSKDGKSAWVTYSATTETSCDSCSSFPGPTVSRSTPTARVRTRSTSLCR